MHTLTDKVFQLSPPSGLFDGAVVRNLFSDGSEGARKQLVHRAVQSGEVLRLRRGLYCLAPRYLREVPHRFVIAARLHGPSHVSLESALAYHGLIPEAVRGVTSVTRRRSRSFTTPLGWFSYTRVPTRVARAGVEAVPIGPESWAFLATPVRAIADLIYTRSEVSWKRDGLGFLTESMRVEPENLAAQDWSSLDQLLEGYRSRRTIDYMRGARKELGLD